MSCLLLFLCCVNLIVLLPGDTLQAALFRLASLPAFHLPSWQWW